MNKLQYGGLLLISIFPIGFLMQVFGSGQSASNMSAFEFIMVAAGVLFLLIAAYGVWALYQKGDPVWPQRFAVVGMAGIFIFGGLTWMFGERWVSDPLAQQIIDQRTGDDRYMQWQDNAGRWQRGVDQETGELLHPKDCRPRTLQSVFIPGEGRVNKLLPVPAEGFDYETEGTCFNPQKKGVRMTPLTEENTPIIPKFRVLSTPAEKLAEEVAEQEKIDAAQQRRIEASSKPAIVFPLVDQDGCMGSYASQVNCKRVTLHATAGDSIDWVVDKSVDSRTRCIQFNPSSQLQTSLLRNDSDEPVGTTFTFTGNGQMTYTIFEVPVGQSGPGGARCGS